MKKEALTLLKQHFAPSIVKNFVFLFEAELYDGPKIRNQIKDDKMIMEVRYKTDGETSEYICDIFSWMTKKQAEFKLLTYITDVYKSGKIGKNWKEEKGRISEEVRSGKHATKDEL